MTAALRAKGRRCRRRSVVEPDKGAEGIRRVKGRRYRGGRPSGDVMMGGGELVDWSSDMRETIGVERRMVLRRIVNRDGNVGVINMKSGG